MSRKLILGLLLVAFAVPLVAGCNAGTVSSEGMQESQKKIDEANAKIDGKAPTGQN